MSKQCLILQIIDVKISLARREPAIIEVGHYRNCQMRRRLASEKGTDPSEMTHPSEIPLPDLIFQPGGFVPTQISECPIEAM
eukprot:2269554-Amphidinium_carterae.1